MSYLKTKRFLARIVRSGSRKAELSVIVLSNENELLSIFPFQAETSHTHYCDGLLLILAPACTISDVKNLIDRFPDVEDLIHSPTYIQNQPACGNRCRLYQISNIDWDDLSFTSESEVTLVVG